MITRTEARLVKAAAEAHVAYINASEADKLAKFQEWQAARRKLYNYLTTA